VGKAKSNEKVLKMSVKYRAKGLKYHKPIVNTISIKATINHATARRISATSTASPFETGYSDDVDHSFRVYVDQHSEVSINNSKVC
jgi:hypothetical protein